MAVIQSKSSGWVTGGAAITVVLDDTPVSGNTLVAFVTTEGSQSVTIDTAGWSRFEEARDGTNFDLEAYSALGSAGDTVHLPAGFGSTNRHITVYEVDDAIETSGLVVNGNFAASGIGTISGPTLTQAEEAGNILAAFTGRNQTYAGTAVFTAVSPLVAFAAASKTGSARVHAWSGYGDTVAGNYTPQVTVTGLTDQKPTAVVAVILSHDVPAAPVADFDYDPISGVAPLSVTFTDTSTGTPTSWAWDFGDGDTSTSQNPVHIYDAPGTYSVTLTATNAFGSDDVTKVAIIQVTTADVIVDPLPGLALIEIYAAEAGAARWDVALWDVAVWSSAAWQDVTPQSVDAVVTWGSTRPEMGILSKPNAGAWSIRTYDPERLLDPANADGPYYADLEPNLPVRITHRGVVIRQGFAESIVYEYATDSGQIKVYDSIALMANAAVPPDTMLADTLYARAVDAIAAAGLDMTVLPVPPSGDPALVEWVTDTEWSVWQWITDAAEQVLQVAYVDRLGRVGFRPWSTPLARGTTLDASRLIGLASITQWNGLYSVIQATDGLTITERALTPPPRYGARTYQRTDPVPDPTGWAEAVLADRAFAALRWTPGTVYPLTADDVEEFARIENVELVGLVHEYTDPEVFANLIIVGGEIVLTAKKDDEAKWWFTYEAAQTPLVPLITEDESGFLTNEAGTDFLYPDV